jgi:predicted regulator of Ras-like GTPase activity (Roadblock/LC7/MglB family)
MPVQPTGKPLTRSARLDQAITDLLREAPEIEAAAVVSFDGLPMASGLPASMDEDRVAAMSAALLSLGERAAQGLGRGELSQVYIEGESGTVFLVSADDEAVLVAVAAAGAKAGMMLYEVRRAAAAVAEALRADRFFDTAAAHVVEPLADTVADAPEPVADPPVVPEQAEPVAAPSFAAPAANGSADGWSSYAPGGTVLPGESGGWS